jgi:S1-C subfamily serine protease
VEVEPLRKETFTVTASKFSYVLPALLISAAVLASGASALAGSQGWLGVVLQPLDSDLREAMDLDSDVRGVLISDVVENSPADEYGLREGDVIIMIGDAKIVSIDETIDIVKSYAPGEDVKVMVLRNGRERTFSVALGDRSKYEHDHQYDYDLDLEQLKKLEVPHMMMGLLADGGYLGVRIEDISEKLGDYFDVGEGEGVLVLDVMEDSPAEEAGLEPGDVIMKVDGKEVHSTGELQEYISDIEPGDDAEIEYKRKRRTRTVEVEIGEHETTLRVMKRMKMPRKMHIKQHDTHWKHRDHIWGEGELEELKEEMEELRREMLELKKELEELRES